MGVGYQGMVIIFSLACIILETWLQQLLCSCQAGLQGNIVFVVLEVILGGLGFLEVRMRGNLH